MKHFILIASIALLASCGFEQEAATLETPTDTTTTVVTDTTVTPTVIDSVVK